MDWYVALIAGLSQTPASEQELFRLRYIEGMPVSRIASLIDSSETTVRRRLRHLKATLIRTLSFHWVLVSSGPHRLESLQRPNTGHPGLYSVENLAFLSPCSMLGCSVSLNEMRTTAFLVICGHGGT